MNETTEIKKHTVTVDQLNHALSMMEHRLAHCSSLVGGYHVVKSIVAVSGGGLRVKKGEEIVWEGIQPFVAMEVYNEL